MSTVDQKTQNNRADLGHHYLVRDPNSGHTRSIRVSDGEISVDARVSTNGNQSSSDPGSPQILRRIE